MPSMKLMSVYALVLSAAIADHAAAQSFGGAKPSPASTPVASPLPAPASAPVPSVVPSPGSVAPSASSNAVPQALHIPPAPRAVRRSAASSQTRVAPTATLPAPVSQASIAYLVAASDYLRAHAPVPVSTPK